MKKIIQTFTLTALASASIISYSTEKPTPLSYNTALLDNQNIVIDGNLDELVWHSINPTVFLVTHDTVSTAKYKTWVKVAYDTEAVYFAFSAQDEDIAANHQNYDDPIFKNDDAVEIFIDPDGNGLNYLEIGVSPQTAYDVVINSVDPWMDDLAWNLNGFDFATTVNGTLNDPSDTDIGWTAELKIPFSSLNYPEAGFQENTENWRINLFRAEYSSHAKDWEANEWQSWSPIGSFGFHKPVAFGTLYFTDVKLWTENKSYTKGDLVYFLGSKYEARQIVDSHMFPPSESQLWKKITDAPQIWNPYLTYQGGDLVFYKQKQYKAKWSSKSDIPDSSAVWELVEE